MKTLLLTLLLTSLVFAGMAGTKEDSIKIVELENKVKTFQTELSKRDALYESHLKEIQTERNNLISFVHILLVIVSIVITLIVSIGGFLGYKGIKELYESRLKAYSKKLEKKSKNKILTISDNLEERFNTHADNIHKIINDVEKDAELKKTMSICLIYSDESKMKEVKLQLLKFGIENITEQSFEKVGELSNDKIEKVKENILFIIDSTKDEEKSDKKNTQLCFHVGDNKSILNGRNVFYKGSGTFPNSSEYTSNFAKTNTTIYQNLLDLMRYVDFKKK